MALVRCSRGVKTRALEELARKLKAQSIPVVIISLNDHSLNEWEKADVGAVCRRIAFAASRDRDFDCSLMIQYERFAKQEWDVTGLGEQPCVLLIDELNNLPQSALLADFLKRNFVSRANRNLVFSSHVLATNGELAAFMDDSSSSKRGVVLLELPLIPSLLMTQENFDWPSLNPQPTLYYGKVPALIHEAHLETTHVDAEYLPALKRGLAIEECRKGSMLTQDAVRRFMGTFITGSRFDLLTPLESLMATRKLDVLVVEWIPYHMMEALRTFSFVEGLGSWRDCSVVQCVQGCQGIVWGWMGVPVCGCVVDSLLGTNE
jgi:hypothetical protein